MLTEWDTMIAMLFLGEHKDSLMTPLNPVKRQILLGMIEAALLLLLRDMRHGENPVTSKRLLGLATEKILPKLHRLLELYAGERSSAKLVLANILDLLARFMADHKVGGHSDRSYGK